MPSQNIAKITYLYNSGIAIEIRDILLIFAYCFFVPAYHGEGLNSGIIPACLFREKRRVIVSKDKHVKLSAEFNDEAHKLVFAPDDFFANFQTAMLGDEFSDSVEIFNTTNNETEVFFRTALES